MMSHGISTESLEVKADDDLDLIQAIVKQLHIKTSGEIDGLREVLFPSILCAMVHSGVSPSRLEVLRVKYGADMAMANYDGRTPLHVAASEGQVATVDYLMRHGAGIHVRDRNNDTPLMCAINAEQKDTIRALRACGAHLQLSPLELGEKLCSLARLGLKRRLKCYKLAGADLNCPNLTGQTALHMAAETGQIKVVQFLIENNVNPATLDGYGLTASNIAKMLKREDVFQLLQAYEEKCSATPYY